MTVAQILLGKLQELPWIKSIIQVGSSVTHENVKDIDLLLISSLGEIGTHFDEVQNLLLKISAEAISRSDDAVRFKLGTNTYDVAIYEYRRIEGLLKCEQIDFPLVERATHWATKAWIPETLISDIKNGVLRFDRENQYQEILKLIETCSEEFWVGVLERCKLEIRYKADFLLKSSLEYVEYYLFQSDLIAALIRYVFASEKVYLKGFKNLGSQFGKLSAIGQNIAQDISNSASLPFNEFYNFIQELDLKLNK